VRLPSERMRRLFFAGLGVVFVMAFLSLRVQIDGLIGARGILPAEELMKAARGPASAVGVLDHPTLFWFGASDAMLHGVCVAGIVGGALLVAGVAPIVMTPACWLLYLSLERVSGEFLRFQWDSLLLESALFASFFAPAGLLPWRGKPKPPTFASLWALRLLLFRFMFASGAVKLTYGDPCWADCTALTYHYYTQPLPTVLGWFAHQMPLALQRWCCGGMFGVELFAPWLLFLGRIGRQMFALATAGLMVGIGATGNYGFFEPLTVVLCLPLLCEESEPAPLTHWTHWIDRTDLRRVVGSSLRLASSFAVALLAALGLALFAEQLCYPPVASDFWRSAQQAVGTSIQRSESIQAAQRFLEPFTSLNTYGLFRVMTKDRPSLEIQGSDDQATWKRYDFKWKEGDLAQPPRWCEPHMPRLDWQMWFEALNRRHDPPSYWFQCFVRRLLEGEPSVLALLESDPFPGRPPRFIRVIRFDYEFTTPAERAATGNWWRRQETGVYLPPVGIR
jgi:lipase maturation factor 1